MESVIREADSTAVLSSCSERSRSQMSPSRRGERGGTKRLATQSPDRKERREKDKKEREDGGRHEGGGRSRTKSPDRKNMGRGRDEDRGGRRDDRRIIRGSPDRTSVRREERGRRDERGDYTSRRSHSKHHQRRSGEERGRDGSRSSFGGREREGEGREKEALASQGIHQKKVQEETKKEKEEGKGNEKKEKRKNKTAKGKKSTNATSLRWREMGDASIAHPLPVLPSREAIVNSDTRRNSPIRSLPIPPSNKTISPPPPSVESTDKRRKSSPLPRSSPNEGKEKTTEKIIPLFNTGPPPTDPRLAMRREEAMRSINIAEEVRLATIQVQQMASISSAHERTKPVHDSLTLCFDLPYGCDYNTIIAHYEKMKARVTVLRRPLIDRMGVVALKYECAKHAEIVWKFGDKNSDFEGLSGRVKTKPSYPGLIAFSSNTPLSTSRENNEVLQIEKEMHEQFGSVAEMKILTSTSGTVWFVDEKDAERALSTGTLTLSLLPGVIISFKGVPLSGEVEEWMVEVDEEWPHHRAKMREARSIHMIVHNKRKPWTHPDKKQLIKNQSYEKDGARVVTLVGGPLVFGLAIESVKEHFTSNFNVLHIEPYTVPPAMDYEAGIVQIVVKEEEAVALLSVKHSIDNFTFYVGLPGPIEITMMQSMSGREMKMLANELGLKFGAVIGTRLMSEVDGNERYRITFMNWECSRSASNWLSVCKGQKFLSWKPENVLVDVVPLNSWKDDDETSKTATVTLPKTIKLVI